MSRLLLIAWLLLTTGPFSPSYAWNRATHMATGAMAYRELMTNSPRTAARIVAILKQHPEYSTRWAGKLNDPSLSEQERNEYLFMLAARWPDDVRGQR